MRIKIQHQDSPLKPADETPKQSQPDGGLDIVTQNLTSSIRNMSSIQSLKDRYRRWQSQYFASKRKRLF